VLEQMLTAGGMLAPVVGEDQIVWWFVDLVIR